MSQGYSYLVSMIILFYSNSLAVHVLPSLSYVDFGRKELRAEYETQHTCCFIVTLQHFWLPTISILSLDKTSCQDPSGD
ncbi:hypothetical protein VTO42DRAFT_7644 [Malbranchea cinnamomea]